MEPKFGMISGTFVGLLYLAAGSGCASPLLLSERYSAKQTCHEHVPGAACASCQEQHGIRRALPYVAGPFLPRYGDPALISQPATLQPPHSKFHPVPTRPVFERQPQYAPPELIGMGLVPQPDAVQNDMLLAPSE